MKKLNTRQLRCLSAIAARRKQRGPWLCALCGKPVDKRLKHPNPQSGVCDHIRQRSEGGQHTLPNLRIVHHICNARRERVRGKKAERLRRVLRGYRLVQEKKSFLYYVPISEGETQ